MIRKKIVRLKSKSLIFPIGVCKEDSEASFGDTRHGTLQNKLHFGCVTHKRQGHFQMEGSTHSIGAGDRTWDLSWKSVL